MTEREFATMRAYDTGYEQGQADAIKAQEAARCTQDGTLEPLPSGWPKRVVKGLNGEVHTIYGEAANNERTEPL